ncbi:MAG TPA: iron-containing redox enzyme family protein [Planctomycetota bacterium]|nr:iron-containing redox enzyme family protein [Planctomycetota bacterium]
MSSSSTASAFMATLNNEIHAHPFLSDPFVKRLSTPGGVTREQARRFALLYYPHIFRTRLYQACALGICPDERVQYVLADILWDEYGKGDFSRTHPAVYRKFLAALDVPEAEYAQPRIFPELAMYIETMMRLCQSGDWLEAAAAVGIASEWPIPSLYGAFLQGLRTVPGLTEDDLELFTSHIGIDEHHSEIMKQALMPYALTENGQARIRRGVRSNLDSRRVMMAGLFREVFEAKL